MLNDNGDDDHEYDVRDNTRCLKKTINDFWYNRQM